MAGNADSFEIIGMMIGGAQFQSDDISDVEPIGFQGEYSTEEYDIQFGNGTSCDDSTYRSNWDEYLEDDCHDRIDLEDLEDELDELYDCIYDLRTIWNKDAFVKRCFMRLDEMCTMSQNSMTERLLDWEMTHFLHEVKIGFYNLRDSLQAFYLKVDEVALKSEIDKAARTAEEDNTHQTATERTQVPAAAEEDASQASRDLSQNSALSTEENDNIQDGRSHESWTESIGSWNTGIFPCLDLEVQCLRNLQPEFQVIFRRLDPILLKFQSLMHPSDDDRTFVKGLIAYAGDDPCDIPTGALMCRGRIKEFEFCYREIITLLNTIRAE